jgi:protein TonB
MPSLARVPAFAAQLDGKRIVATSGAIAVHVAVLMMLMMPAQLSPPPVREDTTMTVIEIKPLPTPPLPPEPVERRLVRETAPRERPLPTPVAVINDTPSPIDPYVEQVTIEEPNLVPLEIPPQPALAQLRALEAPAPTYPPALQRRGIEGVVGLRILVGPDGRATDVMVETSSGYREFDAAAVKVVRARWRFEPAQVGGAAVAAWAVVRVGFALR